MTKIFVISMDNEIGQTRRAKLKYEYEWFIANDEALPFIKDKMYNLWNTKEKVKKAKCGVMDSYYRLLRKIYEEKLNDVIIAEDDCQLIKLPEVLPDTLCYLNGLFINNHAGYKNNWKKYNDFNKEHKIHEIDYSKSRILGLWGIYIPKYTDVKPIINMIENSKRLRASDIMIMKNQFIKHYIYPACFYVDDGGYSQIGSKIVGIHKNYK